MDVYYIPLDAIDTDDPNWSEHVDHYVQTGTMTTDHAASSYGGPVIVGHGERSGVAYGPGDVFEANYSGMLGTPRNHAIEDAASAAGWRLEPHYSHNEQTY